ncbi:MAG: hypothetical protein D3925_00385 [Candidatus Electrothrix sp. AR5]|nr:hypothetical protein [Candidatus Electrothrix sp. AR5]
MNIIDADIKKMKRGLELDVIAFTPTLGWKDVVLSLVQYATPPADGIQDVILCGRQPGGITLPAIELHRLSVELLDKEWFRGVCITRQSDNEKLITLRTLVREKKPIGTDMVMISAAGLKGDKLLIDVSYAGGCAPHDFQLEWNGDFLKSNPQQVMFNLSHNGNGDACQALIRERLQFDLSPILEFANENIIHVKSLGGDVIAHDPRS